MKLIINSIALIALTGTVCAASGTCKKCEVLRKYHEDNPNAYEFYDDYLKALEAKQAAPEEIDVKKLVKEQEGIKDSEE